MIAPVAPIGRGVVAPFARVVRLVRRLDNRGATLVEFGLVAPMLFLLLFCIIDLGLMLLTQALLDGATRDAARLIRTGQAEQSGSSTGCGPQSGSPISAFQSCLCYDLSSIMSTTACQSNILFEVNNYSGSSAKFGNIAFSSCTYNANATGVGTQCPFNSGQGTDIVAVQVSYPYHFIVPWVSSCLTPGGNCWVGPGSANGTATGTGVVLLISTVVMKNEPFPQQS